MLFFQDSWKSFMEIITLCNALLFFLIHQPELTTYDAIMYKNIPIPNFFQCTFE